MISKLKRKMPSLYEFYVHLKRKKKVYENNRRKKISQEQYPFLIADQYFKRIGRPLNWDNIETYTEKMQWEKLYNKNPMKSLLADKYRVREWVRSVIGEEYLIPLLGVWDRFEDIDFTSLPERFVLKTNHGSGTNIIVRDKNTLNKKLAKTKLNDWLAIDYGFNPDLELHYSAIPPKIIAEQYIESEYGELQDYKFLCFGGEPYYCWVDIGRYTEHTRNVYDLHWQLQPWNQETYSHYKEPIPKPKNFDKMIELARILSQGFSHVRVDLYNVDGVIYFGEMTFTNGSGLDRILPDEYDKMLGDLWHLPIDDKKE